MLSQFRNVLISKKYDADFSWNAYISHVRSTDPKKAEIYQRGRDRFIDTHGDYSKVLGSAVKNKEINIVGEGVDPSFSSIRSR